MVSTPSVAVPPRRYGGTELVVHELVRGLVERGHEVTLFATGDSDEPCELRALCPRAVWPPGPLLDLAHAAFAAEQIARARRPYDVAHVHVASFLAIARLLPELPVVYTLHHDRDERLSDFYARVPDRVEYVAISERQAELHPELVRRSVVHHGVDAERYPAGGGTGGYVAFLGRLSYVKGPDTAIRVAGAAGKQLRIGGRPHEEDAEFAKRVLAPLIAQPHVRALGELGHDAKVELLGGAEALVFPIRWEEPFGLVMIEAMLCGCPVVAFRGGAVEEVVEHGRTGLLADDEQEMAALLRSAVPLLDRRAVRARAVARFSRDRMVEGYLDVYRGARSRAPLAPLWEHVPRLLAREPAPP